MFKQFSPMQIFSRLSMLLLCACVALPLLTVLWALLPFSTSDSWGHLWQTTLPSYVANTVVLMLLVGVISSLIGVTTAWLVSATDFPGRKILSWALVLPLAAPPYIIAYLYTDLLDVYGPLQTGLRDILGVAAGTYWFPEIRNIHGAAFMLGLVLYPYIYLLARASFMQQSASQWQAARSLGLRPMAAFWRVVLPAARPAIAGGLALVLMETLADFGVADYFAIPTFSTGIFRNWLALGDRALALKLAAMMLLLVFMLVMLEWLSRRGQVASRGKTMQQASLMRLTPLQGMLAFAICALPVLLGFLIPVANLVIMAISTMDTQWASFFDMARNSLTLAGFTAVIALGLALFLAYMQRTQSGLITKASIRLATLGYALPGALLAVGLLAPIGAMDQSVTRFFRDVFDWQGGLILTGGLMVLIYALVVRFLTVSFNSISSGFEKIPTNMDHAARSLGASSWQVVRRIHLPMLGPSLIAGLMLVVIDVLRELPATLILRPFNFETLASRVYRLASDERLAESSLAALAIIAIGLIPVILLNRLNQNNQ